MTAPATVHESIRNALSDAIPGIDIYEIYAPFDARNNTYRLSARSVIFRLNNFTESPAGSGLYRTNLEVHILGTGSGLEDIMKAITTKFKTSVTDELCEIALAPSPQTTEAQDFDLNVRHIIMPFQGVIIMQQ